MIYDYEYFIINIYHKIVLFHEKWYIITIGDNFSFVLKYSKTQIFFATWRVYSTQTYKNRKDWLFFTFHTIKVYSLKYTSVQNLEKEENKEKVQKKRKVDEFREIFEKGLERIATRHSSKWKRTLGVRGTRLRDPQNRTHPIGKIKLFGNRGEGALGGSPQAPRPIKPLRGNHDLLAFAGRPMIARTGI